MNSISRDSTHVKTWNTQPPLQTALEAAQQLHWSVIPLDDDKRPCKTGGTQDDGTPKRLKWKRNQEQCATKGDILNWNHRYHPAAFAIVTGKLSGRVTLDFDGDQGKKTLERLGLNPHRSTGSGGYHVDFKHPGWPVKTLNNKSSKDRPWAKLYPGLDIRADGGYAAFCGSNTSGPYTWLRDPEPDDLSILPDDLRAFLDLLTPPSKPGNNQRPEASLLIERALAKTGLEGRNDAGIWLACQLRDNSYPEDEARSHILTYAARTPGTNMKGQPEPYTDEEALNSVRSAYSRPAREPWKSTRPEQVHHSKHSQNGNHPDSTPEGLTQSSFNRTDLGNAERFAARYGDRVRWCEVWNSWLTFNGKYWEQDKTGQVDRLAKATVRSIYNEAASESDDATRKFIVKHAMASESNRAVRAMLDRAKSELPAAPDEFNQHIHFLNCKNGTLDLHTGELRPHRHSDMLTRCLKIDYNPLAPCPKWLQFVQSIFAGETSLIDFMQQALGMSLSGDVSEQCLFICHGAGSNGKTTLLETVRIILEAYGLAANIETFQVHKGERINNDVAELYGARLVTASENTLGSRLNEAFVKKATGKEQLRARRQYEREFEFMPEFTIWLGVNHKPTVKDTSRAMWRRVHFIPFSVTIAGDQVDKHLGEKLLEEAEGILTWLVQGCITWYQQGRLNVPEIVQEATQAYRTEMDVVARFLDECCEVSPHLEVGATVLYQAYKAWCEETGEKWETQNNFGARLTERGFKKERTRSGYVYRGVNLVNLVNLKSDNSSRSENTSKTSAKQGSQGSQGSQNESPPESSERSEPPPEDEEREEHHKREPIFSVPLKAPSADEIKGLIRHYGETHNWPKMTIRGSGFALKAFQTNWETFLRRADRSLERQLLYAQLQDYYAVYPQKGRRK